MSREIRNGIRLASWVWRRQEEVVEEKKVVWLRTVDDEG
jgi:hypothetical protein